MDKTPIKHETTIQNLYSWLETFSEEQKPFAYEMLMSNKSLMLKSERQFAETFFQEGYERGYYYHELDTTGHSVMYEDTKDFENFYKQYENE